MMKQPEDKFTLDIFRESRRGRPPKANAKTPAQRMRDYRMRRRRAVLDTPLYSVPAPTVLATNDEIGERVLHHEFQRHTQRIKNVQAMDAKLRLLEPVIRILQEEGISLYLGDIKIDGDALVIRDINERSHALYSALVKIGFSVTDRFDHPNFSRVILSMGTLKVLVYLTTAAEHSRG